MTLPRITIASLATLGLGALTTGAALVHAAGPRFNASLAITVLVLLGVALENIRLELRDIRKEIEKQRE
jgi:hypothetical protein